VEVGAGLVESLGGRTRHESHRHRELHPVGLVESLSVLRLVIAMVGSVALMIGWLIVDAHLWHRSTEVSREAKQKARLNNASRVITWTSECSSALGLVVRHQLGVGAVRLNDRVFGSMTQTRCTRRST
jgi:hypothetical protein